MWPSLPTANHIADIANWFFIGSLVVGVVSTILIVWMAGVKETYWEKDRTESAERIAELSTQGENLRKETAEATARAAEAQLALEKLKTPRAIPQAEVPRLVTSLTRFSGTKAAIYILADGLDPNSLGRAINEVLKLANWDAEVWNWMGGGAAGGILVICKNAVDAQVSAACDALVSAFVSVSIDAVRREWPADWRQVGGALTGNGDPLEAPIRIIIGTKPQ